MFVCFKYSNFLRFVALVLVLTGININTSSYAQEPEAPEDLKVFLNSFVGAVIAHDVDSVMSLMDVDYKKEQHDAFLKGDTQKFLDNFFCGYDPADGERYECMKLAEITKMKLTTVMPDTEMYIILFHINDADSLVEVTWIVSAKKVDGVTNFGMVGAYG